jgi:large subunit ribosomal protein L5
MAEEKEEKKSEEESKPAEAEEVAAEAKPEAKAKKPAEKKTTGKTTAKKKAPKKAKADKVEAEAEPRDGDGKAFVPPSSPRMLVMYREKVIPQMMKEFGWGNPNRVPDVEMVIINIGIGEGARDIKQIEASIEDIRVITGQQPVITRARKSVAQYKLRAGMPIGLKVTLRGRRMYHFLDKLFNLALPRVRDFQGLNPNSFDGRGNFTLGLKEQLVFPEIDYDKVARVRGMDITIITSARNDIEAAHLLRALGCPLRS